MTMIMLYKHHIYPMYEMNVGEETFSEKISIF
jgi:hypothetical protein